MTCSSCHGTGWRSRDVDGAGRVERCECWRQRVTADLRGLRVTGTAWPGEGALATLSVLSIKDRRLAVTEPVAAD